jgi:glycosyltransferase involved in cell wall biosynthesis
MKILQIVPSISLIYGGPSQMALSLSRSLAAAGVKITLLTTNSNGDIGQAPLDVTLGVPIAQDGYEIIYFPCSPFRRYKFSLGLLQWLARHAQEYDLAHIHALFSPVSTASATVARFSKLPYLLRPLGTLDPADLQKKKVLKQLYGQWLERPNLAQAAAVHFTTGQEAIISERFGAVTQDVIVPLGIDLPANLPEKGASRQALGIAPDVPLVLFLSRIDIKKGLELLIAALENLLKQGLAFHFVLAGANPQDPLYEQQISDRIAQSALAARTTVTGFVKGDRKWGLLQDADVFVLPSAYENFGIAVAEAMAVRTPVVISREVYISNEIEASAAGWVCDRDLDSLVASLKDCLASASTRAQRGENARQLVLREYQWPAIATKMIQVYQDCLDRTAAT